jgi:uncharacterized protein YecT (DUF1311 family)
MWLPRTLLLFALTSSSALRAQDSSCVSPPTTLAERQCLSADLDRSNRALEGLLDSLRGVLHGPAKASLSAASELWLSYRRAECSAVLESYDGGSMGLIENLNCQIELTERRQKELRVLYSRGDE